MSELYPYLDKGYVKVVGHFGDDRLMAKAARASFVKEAYKSDEMNNSLIDYLFYHRHMSPVEMGNITFESKMPIFVMRQHVRHRTFKLNEQSLRYVTHDGDYYLPELSRMQYQSEDSKQGSGGTMPKEVAQALQDAMRDSYESQWKLYKRLVKEEEVGNSVKATGLAKEIARGLLGTGFYTTVVWQADLRNLANYLFLRLDGHAQWEIQEHAKLVDQVYRDLYPMTYQAMRENILEAVTYSKTENDIIKQLVGNSTLNLNKEYVMQNGIKESRVKSFFKKLGLNV